MARVQARLGLIQGVLALCLVVVLGRAAQVQIVRGGEYPEEAARSRSEVRTLEARRGTLYDRSGLPMAVTQELYRVGIAPIHSSKNVKNLSSNCIYAFLNFK